MPPILVVSTSPGAGRTTVAAGMARLLAANRQVAVARLGEDDAAKADAAFYAGVFGGPGRPVAPQDARPTGAQDVWEAPAGDTGAIAQATGANAVLVARGGVGDADVALAKALGEQLKGVVITDVPAGGAQDARSLTVLAALPEDRLLAAPATREVREALEAQTLVEDGADTALEWIVVGPIASDPAAPYFTRWERKAAVIRHDKTDVMLAALATDLDCLIVTGGSEPSPYVLDRVRNEGRDLTVMVSPLDTLGTMRKIETLYGRARFAGERKIERAAELLGTHLTVAVEDFTK